MVQGQIEINLRGLCKGRGIIQRAELQGVTSWPINVGLITPRAVMDTSGACARLSSPPASSGPSLPFDPCPPRVKRGDGERQRDNRRGDEKNTGKHRRDYRPIRKADRSKVFSCSQTPAVSPGSWPYLERTRIFSDRANVRKPLFSLSSNSRSSKKNPRWKRKYIYI